MSYVETAASFGLYGETIRALEPGFVHIEDVAARSRALDWRIDSHRHASLFQVLCIYAGGAQVQIDDDVRALTSGSVIVIPIGVVHAFRFEPGTQGAVLTVAEELLTDLELQYVERMMSAPQLISFDTADRRFAVLRGHLNEISEELSAPATGQHLMMTSLVKMVLTVLYRRMEDTGLSVTAGSSDSRILNGFRKLIEAHFTSQWPVSRYAAALNTSVASLNRRCHRYVGLTAKTIIQHRVLIEAKRRLIYTREPVESVAYALGFSDPAYFSRFFARWEGVPPGVYRRSAAQLRR